MNPCLVDVVKAGLISKKEAEELSFAPDMLAQLDGLRAVKTQARREAAVNAVVYSDSWQKIQAYNGSPIDALLALMAKDPHGKASFDNIESIKHQLAGSYHMEIAAALNRFRTKNLGFTQDKEGLMDLGRAIFGERTLGQDPEIDAFAMDLKRAFKKAVNDYNHAGGSITELESWNLPQKTDSAEFHKLWNGKEEEFKDWIIPLLDRRKMVDDNGVQLDDVDLREALDWVHRTFNEGGHNKTKDFTSNRMGRKMSRKHGVSRFLHFQDFDSWTKYNEAVGKNDIFSSIVNHFESMANDTAAMRVFGTNPQTGFDTLKAMILKREPHLSDKLWNGQRLLHLAEALFKTSTGAVDTGELVGIADVFQTVRNVVTAAFLGKAFLSATADLGFSALTSNYNGISAMKVLASQMRILGDADRLERAVSLGFAADSWTKEFLSAGRFGDVYMNNASGKVAQVVMRASLLEPWTAAGRKAFAMEFSAELARNFGKGFDELPPKLRASMERYGIDQTQWDIFRKDPEALVEMDGGKFALTQASTGSDFHRMITTEMDYAVPTPDARVRAYTTGGTQRGTVTGQLARSTTNLMSFPITVMTSHWMRAANEATLGTKMKYVGLMVAGTTTMGFFSTQMTELAEGRGFKSPDKVATWEDAFVRGGSGGIVADLIKSFMGQYGGVPSDSLGGATFSLVDKAASATFGNAGRALRGEDTSTMYDMAKLLEQVTPSVWYIEPLKNEIAAGTKQLLDPGKFRRDTRAQKKRRKENYDQEYLIEPGETTR